MSTPKINRRQPKLLERIWTNLTTFRRAAVLTSILGLGWNGLASADSLTGHVRDSNGQPAVGATVTVTELLPTLSGAPDQRRGRSWTGQVTPEGKFAIADALPNERQPSTLDIWIKKEGRVDWHTELKVSSLAKGDGCRILDPVTLNGGRVVKGRVLNQDGAPVDQATVVVMAATGNSKSATRDLFPFQPRPVGAGGQFEVTVPKSADAEATIFTTSHAPYRATVGSMGSTFGDIKLLRGSAISGKYVTNGPKSDRWVVLESIDAGTIPGIWNPLVLASRTNAVGEFTFPAVSGRFILHMPKSATPSQSGNAIVQPTPPPVVLPEVVDTANTTQPITQDMTTAQNMGIRGRVTGPANQPLAGIEVSLVTTTGGRTLHYCHGVTNSEGQFLLDGVPVGMRNVLIAGLDMGREFDKKILWASPLSVPSGLSWNPENRLLSIDVVSQTVPELSFQYTSPEKQPAANAQYGTQRTARPTTNAEGANAQQPSVSDGPVEIRVAQWVYSFSVMVGGIALLVLIIVRIRTKRPV